MFAAFLGSNPIASLLSNAGVLHQLPQSTVDTLTGKTFLPSLLTAPFHSGLTIVFILAAALAGIGAVVSLFRGGIYIHEESTVDKAIPVNASAS
jgi:hypothetical protein